MPGVGFTVRVVGLGSEGPKFKSHSFIELISGGVDSACHPSKVGKMSTSLLGWLSHLNILCQSGDPSRIVPNCPGDRFAAPMLYIEYGPNGWMGCLGEWSLISDFIYRSSMHRQIHIHIHPLNKYILQHVIFQSSNMVPQSDSYWRWVVLLGHARTLPLPLLKGTSIGVKADWCVIFTVALSGLSLKIELWAMFVLC